MAASASTASAEVRALLVGNADYAVWPPLPGAARDVETFRALLEERFGVKDLTVLRNGTREQIVRAVDRFTDRLSAGDTAVFYYSGHGAVCLDDTGTDPNGLSECIVAIDAPLYSAADFDDCVLRNSWFEGAIARMKARVRTPSGGNVLLVFDSCHSGSISRGAEGRVRSARGVREYFLERAKPPGRPRRLEHLAGRDGWVLLAACRAEEEAADDKSFTQYLAGVLRNVGPTADYVEVMQRIGATDLTMYQSPQAEGELDVPVLGGAAVPRDPACLVRNAYDGYAELDQGTLVGFTPGSRVGIFQPGTRRASDKAAWLADAVVEADDASPFKVTARVTQGKAQKGAVCFLLEQVLPDASLRVYADRASTPLVTERAARIVPAQDAQIMVVAQNGRSRVSRLSAAGGVQAVLYEGPPTGVARVLHDEARRQALISLVSGDALAATLTPGRFTMRGSDIVGFARSPRTLAGTDLAVHDGDQAELTVTNRGDVALYITVLYFDARGGVDVLYPPPGGTANWKALEPQRVLRLPTAFSGSDCGRFSVPQLCRQSQAPSGEGREAFKILGTKEKIDTTFLRTRSGAPGSVLEKLLGDAAEGTRGDAGTKLPAEVVIGSPLWVRITK